MPNTIKFCGGARHVTGANYLLEVNGVRFLVDCGLFQGCHDCEGRNFNEFPYDPATIDALIVTHAHIDHTGRIPSLVRRGFRGAIYSTEPTKDFAEALLKDAMHIIEEERSRREKEILYTEEDIEQAMTQWKTLTYGASVQLNKYVKITLRNAGHILGSAMVEVAYQNDGKDKVCVFTGDLGNPPSVFVPDPEPLTKADFLVIDCAYGDRSHSDVADRKVLLQRAVEDAIARKGTLMIPAFAMERTQELIFELNDLVESHRIPQIPVFVDSPLATSITRIFSRYRSYYSKAVQQIPDDVLSFPGLKFTESTERSKAINNIKPPKVIIAGSGMSNAGRILHHERRYLSDKNSILLITGYQVAGSLGRRLLDGAPQVKMFEEVIDVHCEVRQIQGYSAHADQEQLFAFISAAKTPIERIFAVQGEESATLALVQRVRDYLGIDAKAPMWNDVYGI